jgi:hypothetical protein
MLRFLIVFAACVVPFGCRSPNNCRVPPPGTGSYGAPNAYYPGAPQRTSAVAPRTTDASDTGWRNVSAADQTSLVAESVDNGTNSNSSKSKVPRVLSTSAATGKPIDPPTTTSPPRLNPMYINEVKPTVAPASFESATPPSKNEGTTAVTTSGTPNSLRSGTSALRTDSFQSRSAPAPNRFDGG